MRLRGRGIEGKGLGGRVRRVCRVRTVRRRNAGLKGYKGLKGRKDECGCRFIRRGGQNS